MAIPGVIQEHSRSNPRNAPFAGGLPLRCYRDGPYLFEPDNRAEYDELARRNEASMHSCRKADPELFDNLDSASIAHDIDAVRSALGEDRLSFLAESYGGVVGASYLRQFPDHVRAMALDGAMNHVATKPELDALIYPPQERQFTRFVDWCQSTPDCALHGEDVRQSWQELLASADRQPVPVPGHGPEAAYRAFDLTVAIGGFLDGGPAPEFPLFRAAANAIVQARDGDASGFAKQFAHKPKLPAIPGGLVPECLDGLGYASYEQFAAARDRIRLLAPNTGGTVAQFHRLGCVGWSVPVTNPPAPLPSGELPRLLGIAARTEVPAIKHLINQVPGSSMVRYTADGHSLYLTGNRCAIERANEYFAAPERPLADIVCHPDGKIGVGHLAP